MRVQDAKRAVVETVGEIIHSLKYIVLCIFAIVFGIITIILYAPFIAAMFLAWVIVGLIKFMIGGK